MLLRQGSDVAEDRDTLSFDRYSSLLLVVLIRRAESALAYIKEEASLEAVPLP